MVNTKIKICGVTNEKNILEISKLNIDAIGFNLATGPRKLQPEQVKKYTALLPPFIKRIGVFTDSSIQVINRQAKYCHLDMVQIHSDISPDKCNNLKVPYIKVFRIDKNFDFNIIYNYSTRFILFDTYVKNIDGGTGKTFDWSMIPSKILDEFYVIIAGGITPDNVNNLLNNISPYAVDVASGVESSKGIKDINKIRKLIKNVKTE